MLCWAIKVFMPDVADDEPPAAPEACLFAFERLPTGQVFLHPVISFGANSDCTAPGLPRYTMSFDAEVLYAGTANAAQVPTGTWLTLDRFGFRSRLFEALGALDPTQQCVLAPSHLARVSRDTREFVDECGVITRRSRHHRALMQFGSAG
ncbi:hypothetical protein WJX72_004594 [[Myrmecia] bisecta]|uniref:Uncharacterized protein n=1 Tax=[Myrmecia] bisecta TaxID=41462 RepID=A0AAW1P9Q1_9CHLO